MDKIIGAFDMRLFNNLMVVNNIDTIELGKITLLHIMNSMLEKNITLFKEGLFLNDEKRASEIVNILKSSMCYFDFDKKVYNLYGKEINFVFNEFLYNFSYEKEGKIQMYQKSEMKAVYEVHMEGGGFL